MALYIQNSVVNRTLVLVLPKDKIIIKIFNCVGNKKHFKKHVGKCNKNKKKVVQNEISISA